MKKILAWLLCCAFSFSTGAQINTLTMWEYWFDDGSKTTESISGSQSVINKKIETAALGSGVHRLNYRVKDGRGAWSGTGTHYFLKLNRAVYAKNTLASFEYWWDDGYASRVTKPVSGMSVSLSELLDASALGSGVHRLNYRVKDGRGAWSGTGTHYFLKLNRAVYAKNTLASLQYSLPVGYASRVTKPVSGMSVSLSELLDASALGSGVHRLNYRVKDGRGAWSGAGTHYFLKLKHQRHEEKNKIAGYKYWLNNNGSKVTEVEIEPINPYSATLSLDVSGAEKRQTPDLYKFVPSPSDGKHRIIFDNNQALFIQFKDLYGQWSAAQIDSFAYDYSVPITPRLLADKDTLLLKAPPSDSLHYYCFDALEGDSLEISLNRKAVIDFFNPYGKKLRSVITNDSLTISGVHADLDGEYYAFVHFPDSNRVQDYQLTYTHIAKYAVLGYNVKEVGNKGITAISFNGNGFNKNTTITISKDSTIIHTKDMQINGLGSLVAWFDFTNAEMGMYDITFDFDAKKIMVKDGLRIVPYEPASIAVTVMGNTTFRSGSETSYTIVVKNKGNTTAYFVPLSIAITYADKTSISQIKLQSGFPKTNLYALLKNDVDAQTAAYLKEFDTADPGMERFVDDGTALYSGLLISEIGAKEEKKISFSIKANGDIGVHASVPEEWNPQNEFIPSSNDALIMKYAPKYKTIHLDGESERLLVDKINCFVDAIGCALSTLPVSNEPACMEQTIKDMLVPDKYEGYASTFLNVLGSIKESKEKNRTWIQTIGYIEKDELWDVSADLLTATARCVAKNKVGSAAFLSVLKIGVPALKLASIFNSCVPFVMSISSGECFGMPNNGHIDASPIRSYDPNDKTGYRSASGSAYYNELPERMPYIINFENDAEKATAAAQQVIVIDTLDLSKFDIDSFRAGEIKIGNRIIRAPYDVQEYTWQVDMRPEMELRTEVTLTLDKDNGIAKWIFRSIDPLTDAPIIDPWAGFLPINDAEGSGLGFVSFDIKPKAKIEDTEAIVNRAKIIFDYNEPMITAPWKKIRDI